LAAPEEGLCSVSKYCDVFPGSAKNNLWVRDLIFHLWDKSSGGITIDFNTPNLLLAHCVNSSVFLVPIHCLVCVLLPRLLFTVTVFTSHLELVENYSEYYHSRVIYPPRRPQSKLHFIVITCLPNHCRATVAALTSAN
jgi:hypothetical protein